ncbi:TPA: conjugative relaxase [Pseudomonas aeruginosa]|nr:conjugative relaxase [Pseudomonas aeruginosa]
MLNITTISRQSLGKVVSYYADGADDYYAKDGAAMQWQGAGADILGLSGEVEQTRFRQLLDGRIDENTRLKRAAPGSANKERLGYDLTFSAPKGVSLQALVHGDARIIEAHDRAVTAAIREAEQLAMARHTENKKTALEHTNNLVVAKFRHETSRALDPDLHTHAFVLNMTQRRDGQWRALTNDGLIHSLTHLGNVYKAELARELEKAGFQLRYERNGTFDLAHFTDEQIREFSARSQQIEAALAEKGLDRSSASQAEKNQAALATRDKKKGGIDRDELRKAWTERSKALGIDYHSREWAGAGADPERGRERNSVPPPQIDKPVEYRADQVVEFAVKSLTERQAVIDQKQLLDTAMKHGYGAVTVDEIRSAIERRTQAGHLIREEPLYASMNPDNKAKQKGAQKPAEASQLLSRKEWVDTLVRAGKTRSEASRLVEEGIHSGRLRPGDVRYTTHVAQKREREVLQIERMGRGTVQPRISKEAAEAFLSDRGLKSEQHQAVMRVVRSQNQFMGVQGYAGVGKSHMTVAAKDLFEANGYRVTSLAPYGSQVKALQADGLEARTLQSFLKARDKKIDSNTVVFIDEAGVIPARQMHETMKVIEAAGARAVFLGDVAQTKAIEAGKPFDQMMKAGMETARLVDIQRQKDPRLLEAVKLAAEGKARQSLPLVTSVTVVEDANSRHSEIVKTYAALPRAERDQALIITGTNPSRIEINLGVREALGLAGKGERYDLLHREDTTQAERRHSKYYQKGNIIVPELNYANGLQRGVQYTVLDTGPGNKLTVQGPDGKTLQFSPSRCSKLSVYQVEKTELSPGDQVKITRNDAEKDLANGDRFVVKEVHADRLILEGGGRKVELDAAKAMFVGLAYASTVHGAQGLTCDRVFINLDTNSRTTSKDVYYVAISRARHAAEIFTNDASKLGPAINRVNAKAGALDLKQLQKFALDRTAQVKVGTQKQAVEKQKTAGIEKQRDGLDKPAKAGKEKGRELGI